MPLAESGWLAGPPARCIRRPLDETALLLAVLSDRGALPPPGAVLDLAALAVDGLDARIAPPDLDDPDLASAVRDFADRVLARIAADPAIDRVSDAVASLPARNRTDAAAWWASRVLERVGAVGVEVGPAEIRSRTPSSVEGAPPGLADGYRDLVARAGRVERLTLPSDAFVLARLEVLGTSERRLAFSQLVELAASLDRAMPRHLRPSGPPRGALPSPSPDESRYPMGGLSSLSTSGALENLVVSELAYMGDGDADLFDLRWSEGELLYYARDEGAHLREPRNIAFYLASDLVGARFKDPGAPAWRSSLALAAVVGAVGRLVAGLGETALSIDVIFPRDELASERDLCALALRDAVSRGVVRVGEGDVPTLDPTRAHVDLVWVSAGAPPPATSRGVRVHRLVAEPRPFDAWVDATRELVRALL